MPSRLTSPAAPYLLLLAGALLRWWMIHLHPQIQGDALLYGDIAANWLQHGIFGHTVGHPSGPSTVEPTLVRLPGYPAFLALCFAVFGVGKYKAVVYVQALIDLGTCWLAAGFAARVGGRRAGLFALALGVLCPFTAVYAAFPLSETLTLFCIALGFRALPEVLARPRSAWFAGMVFSWSYAAMLRPDGALLALVLWGAWVWYGRTADPSTPLPTPAAKLPGTPTRGERRGGLSGWKLPVAAALLSMLPFIPWTIRNWRTFHVFEPLAPRYANDPGEFAAPGFIRWVKTFTVDFTTTSEVYWNGNSDRIDISWLPARAIDNRAQYEETRQLLDDYNQDTTLTPELDIRFDRLAEERIQAQPLRYYLLLPLARLGDMWFRPRLETGNGELRWWQYRRHPGQTWFAIANAALNLTYVVLGVLGIFRWPRFTGAMVAMIALRCLLLATIEAPETRYTLECFPLLFVLGGCYWTMVDTSLGSFNSKTEAATGLL